MKYWLKEQTYKWIEYFGITEYEAMWWSFFKGVILTLLIVWIF